jgi:hypothetical protein
MAKILDLSCIQNMSAQEVQDLKEFYLRNAKELEKEEWRRDLINKLGS